MTHIVRKIWSVTLLATFTMDPTMADPTPLAGTSATLMHNTQNYKVERLGKHVVVELKQAHQVLSTSDINGGQTNALKYLVNFQSVEANGHDRRFAEILSLSNAQYHQQLADTLKLDASLMASMGTAANVNYTTHAQANFRDITIDAFATAGVNGNALRAGDEARWYQGENGNELIKDRRASLNVNGVEASKSKISVPIKDSGTINIILMINRSLTPGAQAKTATILTEAKSAALAELAIPSKQSTHLATGTGTDQYIIASPLSSSMNQLDSASGHLKLGELIGRAVRTAVTQAISLQNGLERSDTRSIVHALERFGLSEQSLFKQLKDHLDDHDYHLINQNRHAVLKEPKLVAAAYAYAALLDRIQYGTLSENIATDVLLDQAVNAAIGVSGRNDYGHRFRAVLQVKPDHHLNLFVKALAVGWQVKWLTD